MTKISCTIYESDAPWGKMYREGWGVLGKGQVNCGDRGHVLQTCGQYVMIQNRVFWSGHCCRHSRSFQWSRDLNWSWRSMDHTITLTLSMMGQLTWVLNALLTPPQRHPVSVLTAHSAPLKLRGAAWAYSRPQPHPPLSSLFSFSARTLPSELSIPRSLEGS